ncbi:MAG: hypothetical protein QOD99_2583 [Chthoniobacter sp.]|nr:hypothetical protein [Chthoniobacter sp.]
MSAVKTARPFVAVNFALTFDGKISTRNFTPSDFSSKRDKLRLLEIRATGDALLIGKGTLETENMSMGLPDKELREERVARGQEPYPMRVIVSNSGRIKASLKVFAQSISPLIIYSTNKMPAAVQRRISSHCSLHLHESATVDVGAMLAHLRSFYKVKRLICEGGPTLLRSLLADDLVDEINITFCPHVFGGKDAPTLTGVPGDFLPRSIACKLHKMETIGNECFLQYRVLRP